MKIVSLLLTDSNLCITSKKKTFTVSKEDANFDKILQLVTNNKNVKKSELLALLNTKESITQWSHGRISVDGDKFTIRGNENNGVIQLPISFRNKIIGMMSDGDKGFDKYFKFIDKVYDNESMKVRNRLLMFADCGTVDIDNNGDIVAYKVVNSKYESHHRGYYDNSGVYHETLHYKHFLGVPCTMPRNKVDDDDSNTCSHGLHVCSLNYVKHFKSEDDLLLKVVVNPVDIVSIPTDYHNSKCRVCKYTPVELVE